MTILFVVHHVYSSDSESDNAKLIGIYSSKKSAVEAISRLEQKPGFRKYPNGFSIDEYHLDKDYWIEGFLSEE
jgi:hypothetical protein